MKEENKELLLWGLMYFLWGIVGLLNLIMHGAWWGWTGVPLIIWSGVYFKFYWDDIMHPPEDDQKKKRM